MDTNNNNSGYGRDGMLISNDEYMSLPEIYDDYDVYSNEEVDPRDDIVNRGRRHEWSPNESHRQSEQMDNFVDNFIKPKLPVQIVVQNAPNAKLTKGLMQRVSKKRTNFNLIVIGEQGLGKSTFIRALVRQEMKADKNETNKIHGQNIIVERPFVLLKDGQKVYLNIIEVPDFGIGLNDDNVLSDILSYVNDGFEETFKLECSLDRSSSEDRKIHCCLYFISPYGHSLKPLDIAFFKQFQSKINILPIIGKCDIFKKEELRRFKLKILNDFTRHGIDLFGYLNTSEPIEDEIDDIKDICEEIKNNVPFALISSVDVIRSGRNNESGREYPWGVVKSENPETSDFRRLEKILTKSHIDYFKKITKTVHYENFRMKYILEKVKC